MTFEGKKEYSRMHYRCNGRYAELQRNPLDSQARGDYVG
jgi:hypothetical protein